MRRKRLFVTLLCLLVGMRMLAAEQKALVLNFEDGKQWSVLGFCQIFSRIIADNH